MGCHKCLKSNNTTKAPIIPSISVTERIGVKQVITPFTKKRDGK